MSIFTTIKKDAAIAISDVGSEISKIEAEYTSKKAALVAAIQAHIASHQQAAAQHAAEIAAAQTALASAVPAASTTADQAAAFVLTAPKWSQQALVWIGNYWRYPVLGGILAGIAYAIHEGMVHL